MTARVGKPEMMRQNQIEALMDAATQPRARIVATNGDILFVASEGGAEEDTLIVARELARRALNDEFNNDPAHRERVTALMEQRDASNSQPSAGHVADAVAPADAAFDSGLAEALASRAGIGAPPLNRMFDLDESTDE
jgi:hypothetical protein